MCSLCPLLLVKMSGGGFRRVESVHVVDTLADQQFVRDCKGKRKNIF